MGNIKKQLEQLDIHMRNAREDFYSKLNPPLKDNDIKELESRYKIFLPEDLKMLYQWKNGQENKCYESFVNNSMFFPLEHALENAQELTSMIGSDFEIENWWNENWIPIFSNGGGDYICYDMGGTFTGQKGQLIEFWHADKDRNVMGPNLESLIEALNQFYETNKPENFDEYFEIEDLDGFPKYFIVD